MADKRKQIKASREAVLVIGLGLFGSAVATALIEMDVEVLATSDNEDQVTRHADDLTHVVELDSTDAEALQQIGAGDFTKAVVALSQVEKSIMTVLALSEAGVDEIWARAATREHGQILERIGAHHVVYSEASTGRRVAHAVSGQMVDFFEFEHGFAMARTIAPAFMWDKKLTESLVRSDHQVTVVGAKGKGGEFAYVDPETVIHRGDELILSGKTDRIEAFCKLK